MLIIDGHNIGINKESTLGSMNLLFPCAIPFLLFLALEASLFYHLTQYSISYSSSSFVHLFVVYRGCWKVPSALIASIMYEAKKTALHDQRSTQHRNSRASMWPISLLPRLRS